MSMESDLQTLLLTQCPRVYADIAPEGVARPYVTWQSVGGEPLGYLDNTEADKRHTLMQIDCWATSRLAALTLVRGIETAMRTSSAFQATPQGEAINKYEQDTQLFGSLQRFEIYAAR